MNVFVSFVCTSYFLTSRFYYRKTAIFKDLHAWSKLHILSCFLCILCRFRAQLWIHFRILLGYRCVDRFLMFFCPKTMPKIDQKWPQNRPQCVPGRSLASWLHLVIFGHAIFTIFDAKFAQKIRKNVRVEAPLAPRTIEISRFSRKWRVGRVLAPFCNFRRMHLT